MSGRGFDLEATLARLESKIDSLGQKVTLGEARTDREPKLAALRGELDAGRVELGPVSDLVQAPIGPIHPAEILREDFMVPLRLSWRVL